MINGATQPDCVAPNVRQALLRATPCYHLWMKPDSRKIKPEDVRRGAARSVSKRAASAASLAEHLLAMPKSAKAKTGVSPARLDLEPRDIEHFVPTGARAKITYVNGLPVIQAPPGSRKITSEDVIAQQN